MTVKTFGELKPGDLIVGSDGKPVEVLKVYDEHLPETMWEIELDTGEVIKASGNHLWYCETQFDRELHGSRKREAKKLLAKVPEEVYTLLESVIAKSENVETRLIDMTSLLKAPNGSPLMRLVVRVAESIGHVSESTVERDALDSYDHDQETIRYYDAKIFAEQILALSGRRKYRKTPVIVGSVMTTNQMMELSDSVSIPEVKPHI